MFDALVTPKDGFEIERAIQFLVNEYAKSGKNPKPVILHSLRVAFLLLESGYQKRVVIAAILHDMLEDTDVSVESITAEFGLDTLAIIQAVSYNENIPDEVQRYKDMFARTLACGKEAVLVKAADLHINSIYLRLVSDGSQQWFLLEKERYFLEITEEFNGELVWNGLKNRYESELMRLKKEK